MIEQLEHLSRALTVALRRSEHHFMALGDLLASMHPRACRLVERARSVQCLASEAGPMTGAVERLSSLFGRLDEEARGGLSRCSAPLEAIGREVELARVERARAERATRSLRVLCVAQSIESQCRSDLDGALTYEFKQLSKEFEREMLSLFEQLESSRARLVQHREAVVHQSEQLHRSCQETADLLSQAGGAATRSLGVAAEVGAELERQAARVQNALSSCLQALQIHDIVRQRVEHVLEAWISMGHTFAHEPPEEAWHSLHLMACVQEHQLEAVDRLMNEALVTLTGSLSELSLEVALALGRELERLEGSELLGACSRLVSELPGQVGMLCALQERVERVDPEAVRGELEQLEQGARRAAAAIAKVRWLAFNAQIAGMRAKQGETTFVIAAQTRAVVEECSDVMERVRSRLEGARALAVRLSRPETVDVLGSDSAFLRKDCPEAIRRLTQGLSTELMALRGESLWMRATAPEIVERVEQAAALRGQLSGALRLMREMRRLTMDYHRPDDDRVLESLVDLRATYVMRTERQVLDELMGAEPTTPAELDNVELF